MSDVAAYIQRAAERTQSKREFFVEKNIPTQPSNIQAVSFYGDMSSTFILSAYILRSYKELHKDKYLIVSSWPGFKGLFPYVDEYWSIQNESLIKSLALEANSFYNEASVATDLGRSLLECFNTSTHRDLRMWYEKGFTDEYTKTFLQLKRYLPEILSETRITEGFRLQLSRKTGRKIVICPVMRMRSWQKGKSVYLPISMNFWSVLLEQLLDHGYAPVIWQNWFTYDMSKEFVDRCIYLVPSTISDLLTVMRYIGLTLDVHSGISRMAIAARCPFVMVDERLRYREEQDYAIDDLSCEGLPHKYVFSFSTMLMAGSEQEWRASLFEVLLSQLDAFQPGENWGSPRESYEVISYDKIRKRKARRMGVHFNKSSKAK